jgi:hypothetical protein
LCYHRVEEGFGDFWRGVVSYEIRKLSGIIMC